MTTLSVKGRVVELGSLDGLPGEAEIVVKQEVTGRLMRFRVSEQHVEAFARSGGYGASVRITIEVSP